MKLVSGIPLLRVGLLALFLALAVGISTVNPLTFELPNGERHCFFERFEPSERYLFEFKVISGGDNDVDVMVETPSKQIVFGQKQSTGDNYYFTAEVGVYRFCFGNQFSIYNHKIVYFQLSKADYETLAVQAGDKRPIVKGLLESTLERVNVHLRQVEGFQKDYKLRELNGRYLAEDLNESVTFWSVVTTAIILMVGLGQVFILKTFFAEEKEISKNFPRPSRI